MFCESLQNQVNYWSSVQLLRFQVIFFLLTVLNHTWQKSVPVKSRGSTSEEINLKLKVLVLLGEDKLRWMQGDGKSGSTSSA